MSYPQSSSVHRYFTLADSFVEVRQFAPETDALEAPRGLDREGYSRFVIQTCMPQFDGELLSQLEALFPEDPQIAEDLLYGICIEVNPSLEINCVNLRTAATEHTKPAPKKLRKDDPLRRLGQVTRDLERQLKSRVHGQDAAVESLCSAVRKAAAGLSAPNQLDITSVSPQLAPRHSQVRDGPFPSHGEHEDHSLARVLPGKAVLLCVARPF